MRKAEADALDAFLNQMEDGIKGLKDLLAGKVTKPVAPAAPARRGKKPSAVKEGELHGEWDEEEKAFGCLVCETGPYKVGEFAAHLWNEHEIPLASANIEGLTHGRKWQMKKYLEKHDLTEALEGYGRGEREEKAEKPAKKWKKKAAEKTKKPEKKWKRSKAEKTC